ncbi:putative transmembrane protein [uncultured Stenotrophomonas sp.]|uniref:Putative transmembrane protein n=1 Tax=uncultured Stenotrophomonas sp. TaxID=165438 RepID=A0A1Y5Q8H0_9GAMM|nr:putative transmembrane protein [uncultured Stenotrophomonas sp.]
MSRNLIASVVFLAGLLAVCWIGIGYAGTHPLAAVVATVIAACYLVGAVELLRYRQATATLTQALPSIGEASGNLDGWLARLHPGLRNAVRLRVQGERIGLPAPALTPYLVGLLVLLGMLGTLLGMMATLRGTGMALESATDLDAIRSSLAAPVKGLGFAFGTSIAGVATSAALGLLSALLRRERAETVQQLDAGIAAHLSQHSRAFQHGQTLHLLQQQNALMPVLVERLQALADTLERQQQSNGERLHADQQQFHQRSEAAYTQLANTLQQALRDGIAQQANAVGAALQPVVDTTMAGLAERSNALHAAIESAVQKQLAGLDTTMQNTASAARESWNAAIAEQQRGNTALTDGLQQALQQFTGTFEQRSAALLDGVATRLEDNTARTASAWGDALAQQHQAHDALAQRHEQALATATTMFESHARALVDAVQHSHEHLQTTLEERDAQRLSGWSQALDASIATLDRQLQHSGEQVAQRQQQICDTLAQTTQAINEQAQTHARDTLAEIARLVATASEAPRAAAEVVAELRQKLSDSMARDNAMLDERSRLMETLGTLLDAVNHAANEQRSAIDALVSTSAELLERVGSRFTTQVENEAGKLDAAAAHVTGSAVEVASLGEVFGGAVQSFGASTTALNERLHAIEAALDKSLARSDEQLAYYVAQAREVIELSMLSQKQIIGELQQLAGARDGTAGA